MSVVTAPRHLQLRDLLLRRWKSNGVKSGDRIESQNEIIAFCDFSLITVIKTLRDLEADGIIRRQVGKGSFLVNAPWDQGYHRVGLFYNRDVVGGGIFNNAFYTKLVVAMEKAVVSDGHEFVLGSYTHEKMPLVFWDALDVVILTSMTSDTKLDFLDETTGQISVIDQMLEHPKLLSCRIAYADAFAAMFAHFADVPRKYVYFDSTIGSNDQQRRLEVAQAAFANSRPDNALAIVRVNQETGDLTDTSIAQIIADHQPDIIFGYVHDSWKAQISAHSNVRTYPFMLDTDAPGFVVWTEDWMQQILPIIYSNLEDRHAEGTVHRYLARFQP